MKKLFWFDLETTGLDPIRNDIWQIAFKIDVGDSFSGPYDFRMRPIQPDNISEEALAIGGVTREEVMSYPSAAEVFEKIKKILRQYVDPFDKADKYIPSGYNVAHFDCPFLREFFRKMGDKYYGSWFSNYPLDVFQLVISAHALVDEVLPKYRLADVCAYYGIALDKAHNARYDLEATRELAFLLRDLYFREKPMKLCVF